MVQHKKIGAGLALIAGLLGTCVSDAALAMPEVIVGSHLVQDSASAQARATSTDPNETAVTEDDDTDVAQDAADPVSN